MVELIGGRATPEGTRRYTKRHAAVDRMRGFRTLAHDRAAGVTLSSLGIGTYLGQPDDATDEGYRQAVEAALGGGINVVDSAINYRNQRSERAVRDGLRAVLESGALGRDEVFVATKGGFIPFDAAAADPQAQVQRDYIDTGLLHGRNVVGGAHCMDPAFLRDQLDRSRRNLGLATIDLYYVHNPESQLSAVDEPTFYDRLREAFRFLERAVADGRVARYGIATWDGLRVAKGEPGHIDLGRAVAVAHEAAAAVGHARHHFEAVQAPLNLQMAQAVRAETQADLRGRAVSLAAAAKERGLAYFTSASLLQGRLARGLPTAVRARVGGDAGSDAQVALQAVRSAPGVTVALAGMSDPVHVQEATQLLARAAPDAAAVWEAEAQAR